MQRRKRFAARHDCFLDRRQAPSLWLVHRCHFDCGEEAFWHGLTSSFPQKAPAVLSMLRHVSAWSGEVLGALTEVNVPHFFCNLVRLRHKTNRDPAYAAISSESGRPPKPPNAAPLLGF